MHLYFQYICIGLFFGMVVTQILAYQYAKWRGEATVGMGGSTVETAIFALMGLIIAFTFAGAQSRYEYRRQLIVNEMNAVKTVTYRLSLLPEQERKRAFQVYSEYLKKRIEYSSLKTYKEADINLAETSDLQVKLWNIVVFDTNSDENTALRRLLLPALNDLYNLTTTRLLAAYTHTQTWVMIMFIFIALICSVLSGFRMAKQCAFSWSYAVIFSFTITLTMYVILDFEYPRFGYITLDKFESFLVERDEAVIQKINH